MFQTTNKLIDEAKECMANLHPKVALRERGWKFIGEGCFKSAYRKKSVVVKVALRDDGCSLDLKTIDLLRKADLLEYYAKVYEATSNYIIQKFINGCTASQEMCDQLSDLALTRGVMLYDCHNQNAKVVSGKIVLIDCLADVAEEQDLGVEYYAKVWGQT